ncbi:putative phosphate-repressible phosphate permease [Diaporthe ampelina]|uniref:Phosphate transporter n=1 Tax=Diaporthe ampelina TaxID=1214573 RepID=A0A0G2HHR5_9PEZI|nr:putative phosphate-repressible phosphate permease [Diaporthe ampelina]
MAALPQFDYLFAIGTIFSFLDAWNIGANDVANSFATSVASRSLTLKQAMVIASCMEFAGAMAVGAQVTDTIRTKVISTKLFESDPSVLMLGMVCAIVGSSVWLTFATRFTMPVSTTHSIMGGVIGVGIAAIGAEGVNWSWDGVSQVFAAWAIAPGISGIFASLIFLATKYGVMRRKNPVKMAFIAVPFYFFLTSALLTMLIVWKGGSARIDLEDRELPGPILGVGAGVALLVTVFFIPYLYRKILKDDWELKGWQVIQGPLLLKRPDPPARPEGIQEGGIRDYYEGHLTRDELDSRRAAAGHSNDIERHPVGEDPAEYTYSFLQILTASTASFAHGANDVSNAIGPYTTIFFIWQSGEISSQVPVPTWILAFGGAGIVIGLWTYGYNIMRALGNKITLHSPSRGFSMELGAAITIIMATKLKLPVSTTQCICGATVGVGFCNGTWRSINWRMVAWIYMGWFITLPCAGLISGLLMGIVLNAPRWGTGI